MTINDIIRDLSINKDLVLEKCYKIDEKEFFVPNGEKWSAAGHVEHLINSIKPLNQLFLLPKFVMTLNFGKPNRPSRAYEALVTKYNEKLETVKASPIITNNKFGPKKGKVFTKGELLNKFDRQYLSLAKKISKDWNDENLEKYLIPHPLLGKLTVREMMMFTVYHTLHHQKLM